ncbi:MAG: gluconate 2-dehydrogenase subunit 3 family protein [Gemmatimonadota bacterium]
MTDMNRRDAMATLALSSLAALLRTTPARAEAAARSVWSSVAAEQGLGAYDLKFFTAPEFATVRLLSDLIIPRDDRSGSATDAGVPEFMDFILSVYPEEQKSMREGLAWLETECMRRSSKTFVACSEAERKAVLDDIAWPRKARPEMKAGVDFFNSFRDFTASGFWSSKTGVQDLQYMGNTVVGEWTGCPQAALDKLGVRYGEG